MGLLFLTKNKLMAFIYFPPFSYIYIYYYGLNKQFSYFYWNLLITWLDCLYQNKFCAFIRLFCALLAMLLLILSKKKATFFTFFRERLCTNMHIQWCHKNYNPYLFTFTEYVKVKYYIASLLREIWDKI